MRPRPQRRRGRALVPPHRWELRRRPAAARPAATHRAAARRAATPPPGAAGAAAHGRRGAARRAEGCAAARLQAYGEGRQVMTSDKGYPIWFCFVSTAQNSLCMRETVTGGTKGTQTHTGASVNRGHDVLSSNGRRAQVCAQVRKVWKCASMRTRRKFAFPSSSASPCTGGNESREGAGRGGGL